MGEPEAHVAHEALEALALLLKPKFLELKNSATRRAVLRRLPFILIGVLFWAFLYYGTYRFVLYIRSIAFLGEVLSAKLLSMMFFTLTGFLFLSNVVTAMSSFYLSRDLPFLLSKPLRTRDIVHFKACETFTNSSWMVLGFVAPVLLGYGAAYSAGAAYYLSVFPLFLLLALTASGLGASCAHLLTRFFPARRLKEAFLFSGLLMFLALYFAVRSSVPKDMENPVELVEAMMGFRSDYPFLPGYWITGSLLSMLRGVSVDRLYIALLISNGLFFMTASFAVGEGLYRTNLERGRTSPLAAGEGFLSFYPGPRLAVLHKDARLFLRDTGQWSQLLVILALSAVYVYNFRMLPVAFIAEYVPRAEGVLVLLNMLMSGLVLSAVAGRFIYSSVSLEGQAFWIIRAAPVDMERFLLSKFLFGAVPVTALTLSIVALTNYMLGAGGGLMLVSLATAFLFSISVSGLGTGLGALYPKFKYENIASVSMSLGAMAFMAAAFSLVAVTVMLAALIFYLYETTGRLDWGPTLLCLLSILTLNFLAFYLPMRAGVRRCREMDV